MDPEAGGLSDRLVLCYHAISPDWPAALSTTQERFRAHVRHLARRGYRGVTFADLVHGDHRSRVVAITFDDAYRSVLSLAKPVLDEVGWPASLYVPTDWAGRDEPMRWEGIDRWLGGPHEHELLPLGWDELRALDAAGWEVAAHTRSHPHLTRLEDAALAEELTGSRTVCEERLGHPVTTIAYPYGDVDARVIAAAGRAGYTAAAALPGLQRPSTPLEWSRVGVYHHDDLRRFRLKVSIPGRWLQRTVIAKVR